MKTLRFSSVLLAAAIMMPAAASAQTLHFDGVKYAGGDAVGGAQTGPYRAHQTMPVVTSSFDIYCIDYDHTAQSDWGVTYVTFGAATSGSAVTAANRQLGTEKVWGLAQLRAAAWLSTQFNAGGLGGALGAGINDDQWDDVHGAIWSMFSTSVPLTGAMTTIATNAVTNHGSDATLDGKYLLMLDTRAFNVEFDASKLNQGFIVSNDDLKVTVVTPEPSTYVLMGAGLLAVGFVRRRRRTA